MKNWVGTGEGMARKSVCCVGMSVRVFIMYCGNFQHISSIRADFLHEYLGVFHVLKLLIVQTKPRSS